MRAEIIFKDYTIDVVIHPSCATESDFTVNITTGVGPQGYTPKRGIDYWTDEDKNTVIAQAETAAADAAEPVAADTAKNTANAILSDPAYKASIKGDKGDTGNPGYTPKRGVDYWTETDKEEIVAEATPERGVDYWTATDQQAIADEAQSTAEAAAEATATEILNDPEYKASIKGDKGDTGDPGYTPVKGVDYFDGQDGAPGQDGQPGRDGQNGAPGQDGVSPTITVIDITGGHRVTITDADGAHSFDVMNGEDGGGAVQDVQVNGVSVLSDGVANVPAATESKLGVVRADPNFGTGIYSNRMIVARAPDDFIKNGVNSYRAVVPVNQHISTFYGLAKAAGSDEKNSTLPVGQYTESAKSAISEMLNGSVSVSGTTPTISALPGIRYVCGECATLDITLPASGCVDVVFESGSTPTVLTITPPTGVTVKWADEFDPTALEADTTYEINIMDGLGVAASWT